MYRNSIYRYYLDLEFGVKFVQHTHARIKIHRVKQIFLFLLH